LVFATFSSPEAVVGPHKRTLMRLVFTLDAKTTGFREPAALLVELMTTLSQRFEDGQYP